MNISNNAIDIIIESLTKVIRSLECEIAFKDYRIKDLESENEKLKEKLDGKL